MWSRQNRNDRLSEPRNGRFTRSRESPALDRRHACDHVGCTKAFTRKEHLQRHRLNHQEDSKWLCQQCDKSFYRFDLLKRHSALSHGIDLQQPKQARGGNGNIDERSLDDASSSTSKTMTGQQSRFSIEVQSDDHSVLDSGSDRFSNTLVANVECDPALNSTGGDATTLTSHGHHDASLDFSDGALFVPYMHDNGMQWFFDDFGTVYEENITPVLNVQGHPAPFNEFLNLGSYPPANEPSPEQLQKNSGLDLASLISGPPSCTFAICHTLQTHHRDRLLWTLHSDLDMACVIDPLLSLNGLQHGLHFYFKYVSPEHSIFHPSLIVHAELKGPEILQCYGEELSWHIVWAMIILGWLCPTYTNVEDEKKIHSISMRIHEALRTYVLIQITSSPRPSLSLIQLLFLSLIFARYHGQSEGSAGFAINAHGILIDIVEKLDIESQTDHTSSFSFSTELRWFRWIRSESLKRIISQTFILDVQQMMLHGSDLRFSPFKLNFIPPCEDELWYASTPEAWRNLLRDADSSRWTDTDHNFLSMLKHFWKHAPSYEPSSYTEAPTEQGRAKDADTMFPAFAFSRTSRMILYGIIAVAWDLRRRGDTQLLPFRPDVEARRVGELTANTLSTRVHTSFQEWISWWASQTLSLSLRHVALTWWRNCVCLFRLAHTLFVLGSADLEIATGRSTVEGRKIKRNEFLRSTARAKNFMESEGALHGVLGALKVIRDRLSANFSSTEHCQHCSWLLYLAALVVWLYGHALREQWRTSLQPEEGTARIESNMALLQAGLGLEACEIYLDVAIVDIEHSLATKHGSRNARLSARLREPGVILQTIVYLLANNTERRRNWLIEDSVSHLRFLVGEDMR